MKKTIIAFGIALTFTAIIFLIAGILTWASINYGITGLSIAVALIFFLMVFFMVRSTMDY